MIKTVNGHNGFSATPEHGSNISISGILHTMQKVLYTFRNRPPEKPALCSGKSKLANERCAISTVKFFILILKIVSGIFLFTIISFSEISSQERVLFNSNLSDKMARVFRIATDRWPPHEDIFNENEPGMCTEVVRQVFQKMGVQIKITQYPWARAVDLVFKGDSDALFCALYSDERAEHCFFPETPITKLKYFLFIKKKNRNTLAFDTYEDLAQSQVGIVRSFAYPEKFWNFLKSHGNYQEVESDDLNFRKLMADRIDYAVADYANGMLLMQKMGLTDKIEPILSKLIHESDLYLIFSKQTVNPEFVELFSDTLKSFKETEHYRMLNEKYYGKTACCLN
ncbi:hypothetical protein MTBBW1_180005 [Desulfamplus magnetovallimortis]|uniref:Solute-binding protein family 3/N-terminal domain-containing protein n=1 Tax=Desulfamplus magnetovallimortis TaxID=1246637 RepID=A0A1W1HAJ6_9BACT|nr:transporter substrate-binding domain-containing protein [Desulfamplus magnetovallimortis]SLM29442.1 hypothetical protein MTBBW1_180005 [Desulfamplus magnetovallimortis]